MIEGGEHRLGAESEGSFSPLKPHWERHLQEGVGAMADTPKCLRRDQVLAHTQTQDHDQEGSLAVCKKSVPPSFSTQLTWAGRARRPAGRPRQPAQGGDGPDRQPAGPEWGRSPP